MKNANNKTSSRKKTGKQGNIIREDENNSIYREKNDKAGYPYHNKDDRQFDNQAEFIESGSNSKDKK